MHRSFAWVMIAVVALMLAPFAGVLGVPASIAQADTTAPTDAPLDDEIIVITSTYQLRVDDPTTPTGYKPATWSSTSVPGWESGWTVVAAGDFNGDGDAELVAARSITTGSNPGSYVKVFDPIVQPGSTPVDFSANLALDAPVGSMRNVRLLVTGDFDNDGRDEFAFVNYLPGGGASQAAVQVYDNDVTLGWVRRTYDAGYGVMFEDMGVGDFNADGRDDLVLVRNGDRQVRVMNVSPWVLMASDNGINATDWYAVAGGNISNSPSTPGDEITALRDSSNAQTNNLVTIRVASGALSVWPNPQPNWKYNPSFTSISDGNLNDGPTNPAPDDEIVLLRDAGSATGISLLVLNPFGDTMPEFQQATGTGANLFKIVRTGDTDGDGLDEIVILRGNLYRIYTEPNINYVDPPKTETPGAFYTSGGVSNLPFLAVANVDGPGIAEGPVLSVTPPTLSFSLDCGAASPSKPLSITNAGTGSSFAWQAQAIETNGSGWLLIDATSGTTPGTVNVSVRPGVAKGDYAGTVRVTTTDPAVQNKTVEVPVSYAALCSGFSVSPTTLDFNLSWGSTGSKSVAVGGPGPTAWTATVVPVAPTTSCSWMTPSALTGTTPNTVNVVVNATVPDLTFRRCTIIFSASDPTVPGSPQYVTVNLTVPDPGFVVSPQDITIRQATSAAPVITNVTIFRPGGTVDWTASALPLSAAAGLVEQLANGQATITAEGVTIDDASVAAPSWLVFSPSGGTTDPKTPTMMQVSVQPGTAPGTYRAVITVAASNAKPAVTNPVQQVYVTAIVANNFYFTFLPFVTK
jgi:hypothetical protein